MTVVTSTIPAVKSAFVDLLNSLADFVDVQVTYGAPVGLQQSEAIWTGAARNWQQEIRNNPGTVFRWETYDLECVMIVRRPGDDEQEATERVFELFAAVETALRGNIDVGLVPGVVQTLLGVDSYQPYVFDEGREVELQFHLAVEAQLGAS